MNWRRESTTPMDYEWENSNGPVDRASPFMTATQQHANKKRPHSVLDTPSKSFSGFNTPSRPQLREPQSQSYLFDRKPLPAVPSRVANAWEPRTPASVYDFSSGGETPNTPNQNDDSDAATPDTQMSRRMGQLMTREEGSRSKSPKKSSRRNTLLGRFFSSSPSPTKETKEKAPYYSRKAEGRVKKRRTKQTKDMAIYEEQDSPDARQQDRAQSKSDKPGYAAHAASFFGWIEAHPDLPAVLTYYMQLGVNACIGGACLWIIWVTYSAVMADINMESEKFMNEAMVSITYCAKLYRENRCDPETRVPALETNCGNWETCMKQDARQVARALVGAKAFASILNSFVEQLTYKSLLFTAIVVFGVLNISNRFFDVLRSKTSHHAPHPHHPSSEYYPPPATPHRVPSGGYIDHQGYYTPFATPYGSMNPQMIAATQSMPALPAPPLEGVDASKKEKEKEKEATRRSPRKKLWG